MVAEQLQLAAWKLSGVDSLQFRSSQLLATRWSKGTNTAYLLQSAWKQWDSWCTEWKVDPFSCSVKQFLDILTCLFKGVLQYQSINTIRSAVSMTCDHVEGVPMGKYPLVSRPLKGIHILRPPQPRYVTTWDVWTWLWNTANLWVRITFYY